MSEVIQIKNKNTWDDAQWVEYINAPECDPIPAILEKGRRLLERKNSIHANKISGWEDFCVNQLGITKSTAEKFITVANDERIVSHGKRIPASWTTLYELTKLDDNEWQTALEQGLIRPDMERKDVKSLRSSKQEESNQSIIDGCQESDLNTLIEHGHKYGTIYADPPWIYGNQGTRAATSNHYGGMTLDEIKSLPIADLAADNAHLHLWTTNAFLFECQSIMEAWGFVYKSCFVWVKPQMGIGNYWRVSHEFLLLGVRGSCPFLDKSHMSWAEESRTKHSEKPERIRQSIETVSPGPRLELFGRRVTPGWVVWGNEIERDLFNQEVIAA